MSDINTAARAAAEEILGALSLENIHAREGRTERAAAIIARHFAELEGEVKDLNLSLDQSCEMLQDKERLIAALEADKRRLDWLEHRCLAEIEDLYCEQRQWGITRAAIDAAMSSGQEGK